jgi:DNA-binding response OmpR family regulator
MTISKRALFTYGIAVDLVIVGVGVGLLFPDRPLTLLFTLVAAAALCAWKGGASSAAVSIVLSELALLTMFREQSGVTYLFGFTAAAVAASVVVRMILTAAHPRVATAGAPLEFIPDAAHAGLHAGEGAGAPDVVADREIADREIANPDIANRELAAVPQVAPAGEQVREPGRPSKNRARQEARERREAEQRERRERQQHERAEREAQERERLQRESEERALAERRAAEEEAQRQLEAQREQLAREAAEERARLQHELEERIAREASERVAADQRLAEERDRTQRELEERLARAAAEREAAEQRLAEERERAQRLVEERERLAREAEEQRAAAEAAAEQRFAEERERLQRQLDETLARERETAERIEAEKRAAEESATKLQRELEERLANEKNTADVAALEQRLIEERERLQREHEERLAHERENAERIAAEKRAAEEALAKQLEQERAELERQMQERLAAERAALAKAYAKPVGSTEKRGLFDSVTKWFGKSERERRAVNLQPKKAAAVSARKAAPPQSAPASKRPVKGKAADAKPRILLVEKRRGAADSAAPKLRARGIDVEIVERLIDAADEIFRFRPHALFVDSELADFEKIYRALAQSQSNIPLFVTGRSAAAFQPSPNIRYADFIARPYEVDQLAEIARYAVDSPERYLVQQSIARTPAKLQATKPLAAAPRFPPSEVKPSNVTRMTPRADSTPRLSVVPAPIAMGAGEEVPAEPQAASVAPIPLSPVTSAGDTYIVECYHCKVTFEANDADWCSCLTKERTLVCTNCLSCFCKAPPSFKEKFWVEAPPTLFERKTAEARRAATLPVNAPPSSAMRPLVLSVEDDEEIQHIVQRVCSNLGYGFIWAGNGQDGLDLARDYRPNLILSDAFMPKLDGREMCRLLKEDGAFADTKMVVMTGLYTDTKYRSEALKRFHVDEYLAKPVAVTELINLLQKHLDGVAGLPVQEDLHELHRRAVEESEMNVDDGVALADLLITDEQPQSAETFDELEPAPQPKPRAAKAKSDHYEICCFNCAAVFDATKAEWCSCVGRDNTLVCPECNGCFCKSPAQYRERFWMDAPPSLFERKMLGSKRHIAVGNNPLPVDVKRPLILLVEDDENVQLIVRTVVTAMGYGFIVGANGQEGLALARDYRPDLILSDAFMPKLDGREMCRLLKQDPQTAGAKAIIMTGLYTDRKYRNEALDYFKVDDYVAKPLAVDDLIKLFKKHLPQDVQQAV